MNKDEVLSVLSGYKNRVAGTYGILEIGIFGSVARDEAKENSDVDIFVKTATPNPFILVHIKQDVEKLLHQKVDFVRLREKMNPILKAQIEKEGLYV